MDTLSTRGLRAIKPALPYFGKQLAGAQSLYDAETNPDGYVLMAVAEARTSYGPMIAKLAEVRKNAIDLTTGAYDNMLGRDRFRAAFAATMTRTALAGSVGVCADQLCVSSGCGALLQLLGMLLLDPGDAVLLPTPTYAALYNDMGTLAYGHVVDVPTEDAGFKLTRDALEAAAAAADADGHPPRMLLLLHPNNPLGTVYTPDELRLARDFCAGRGLHLVVDEIYANSVYARGAPPASATPTPTPGPIDDGAAPSDFTGTAGGNEDDGGAAAFDDGGTEGRFISSVEVFARDAGVPAPPVPLSHQHQHQGSRHHPSPLPPPRYGKAAFLGDRVHVLWGMSKDWAMSGYRVGVLYTHNAALLEALSNVNYFSTVSNDTQDLLAAMMEDAAFVDGYLAHCRGQLRAASTRLTAILDAAEVPYVAPRAGMFIWIDLRTYLPSAKAAATGGYGADAWARERALTDALFDEEHILFTPGGACHAGEPGWYRCCFAWMPPAAVAVGFHRLAEWAVRHPQHKGTTPATPALLALLKADK